MLRRTMWSERSAIGTPGLLFLMLIFSACGGGGDGGGTPPGELGTLAYVETECRDTKEGFVEHQALRIRQGDREPVTVFETPEVSWPGPDSRPVAWQHSRTAFRHHRGQA